MPSVGPHRADVDDDAAVAGRDHRPDRGLGREQRAADVELDDPVPVVARVVLRVEQHLAGAAADAVDDDVELAEALDRRGDDALAVGLVVTSAERARTSAPAAGGSRGGLVGLAGTSTTVTFAPAPARAPAMADPMAPPPPGTRATLPVRLKVSR